MNDANDQWMVHTSNGAIFGPVDKEGLIELLFIHRVSFDDRTKSELTGRIRPLREILTATEKEKLGVGGAEFRCLSCRNWISTLSKRCPHCGNNNNYLHRCNRAAGWGAVVGFLVLLLITTATGCDFVDAAFLTLLGSVLGAFAALASSKTAPRLCKYPPPRPAKRSPKTPTCEYCGTELDLDVEKCPNCGGAKPG